MGVNILIWKLKINCKLILSSNLNTQSKKISNKL